MILTPPFYLSGAAGNSLGNEGISLANLGVINAVLTLRSLDADTLQFALLDNGNRPAIPDDGQWLTLSDDNGQVLFTGIAKRTFQYPARVYVYEVSNVYQGLSQTPLRGDDGRPFLLYSTGDLGARLLDLLRRAELVGLPLQAPAAEDMPTLYLGPKMGFRAATYGSALEDTIKWVPDLATRMDYSTTPPTLRFACRSTTAAITLDLESDNHHATSISLTSYPEARALGLAITYQRRDGDSVISYLQQSAGDLTAEATRKLSIFLSGQERSDMLVSEALTSAQTALLKVNQLITATGAAVTAVADSAQISLSFAGLKGLDSNLAAAKTAQAGFTMQAATGESSVLFSSITWSGPPSTGYSTMPTTALALRTSGGAYAAGWYPIRSGAFTDPQLATAGATKETRYITGHLIVSRAYAESDAGMASLQAAGAIAQTGWTQGSAASSTDANNYYRKVIKYAVNLAVDAINMSPSAVASAVNAAAGSGSTSLITRAEFVDAPEGLALNYFTRQDWTPYKGTLTLSPTVANIPVPGDFINVAGADTPPEWATMAAPVASTEIDLATGIPRITLGPSPRQDFKSLIDRLRIPQEDNYQAG